MQALNIRLALKRVHKVVKINQNALLKPYIDINIDLRKNVFFQKYFFKLMNNLDKLWKM